MKIAYKHLLRFLKNKPSIEDISDKLFQLGHEHTLEGNLFDIEFTPNRGDCLSLLGLARDLNVFYEVDFELNIYSSEIEKLDLNFTNNVKDKCPAISFLKLEVEDTTSNYLDYLESYFEELKLSLNLLTQIGLIDLVNDISIELIALKAIKKMAL